MKAIILHKRSLMKMTCFLLNHIFLKCSISPFFMAILKHMPANTDFPIQVAISLTTNDQASSDNWAGNNGYLNTFVTLPPGMTGEQFNADLIAFTKKHETADYAAQRVFIAQPLTDMHF